MNSSVSQEGSDSFLTKEEIFQALGVIWLPVLTSLPSPTQLGGTLPQFSPSSGSPRDVRSLARALCSHCRLDPNFPPSTDPLTPPV